MAPVCDGDSVGHMIATIYTSSLTAPETVFVISVCLPSLKRDTTQNNLLHQACVAPGDTASTSAVVAISGKLVVFRMTMDVCYCVF